MRGIVGSMIADGSGADGRTRPWLLAIAFWIFTYALLSLRGALLDQPVPVLHFYRLVATAAGAVLLALVLVQLRRAADRPTAEKVRLALAVTIPAAMLMLAVRWSLESWDVGHAAAPAGSLVWTIVWTGYFAAWVGICVALDLAGHGGASPSAAAADAADAGPQRTPPEAGPWLQGQGRAERVRIDTVDWVQAEGNYVRIHTDNGSPLIRLSLARIEDELRPHGFVRVHRSALCRREAVSTVERKPTGAFVAVLNSGAKIPVSRAAAASLRKRPPGEEL